MPGKNRYSVNVDNGVIIFKSLVVPNDKHMDIFKQSQLDVVKNTLYRNVVYVLNFK